MKTRTLFLFIAFVSMLACKKKNNPSSGDTDVLKDADGNTYKTMKLGSQTWMLENLKTTKLNDGTPITKYTFAAHGTNWLNLNTPQIFYQWADTSDLSNLHPNPLPFDYYGAMYNHLAIESGKLAPKGWRIPTVQDFIQLEAYLSVNGYSGREGLALKSASGWNSFSGNGSNAVGFNGLPNGYINAFGGPTLAEGICTWATSTVNISNGTRKMVQLFNQNTILFSDNPIQIGAGVRCIKE